MDVNASKTGNATIRLFINNDTPSGIKEGDEFEVTEILGLKIGLRQYHGRWQNFCNPSIKIKVIGPPQNKYDVGIKPRETAEPPEKDEPTFELF